MPLWRRGTTEETTAVPGPRSEPTLPPDAGRDDSRIDPTQQTGPAGTTGASPTAGVPGTAEPAAEATRPDTPPVHADGPAQPGPVTRPAQDQAAREQETRERPAFEKPQHHKLRHTRLSGAWVAVVTSAIILVLLLIFILQNSSTIKVSYLGAHWHLPLGVALLFAAVAGIVLTALAGGARIMQLRNTARKHRLADVKTAKPDVKAAKTDVKAAKADVKAAKAEAKAAKAKAKAARH